MEKIQKWSEMTPKEKWTHFLEYYKWYAVIGVVVIALIAYTLAECAANVDPDLSILYAGPYPVGTEQQLEAEQAVAEHIEDYNGDGKVKASLMALYFADDESGNSDPQMLMAMQTKLVVELSSGESQIFLMSESQYTQLKEQGTFSKLTELFGELPGGDEYSLALSETKLSQLPGFKDLPGDTRVAMIIKPEENSKNEKRLEKFSQSEAFFREYILQ